MTAQILSQYVHYHAWVLHDVVSSRGTLGLSLSVSIQTVDVVERSHTLREVDGQFTQDTLSWVEDHTVDTREHLFFNLLLRLARIAKFLSRLVTATLHDTSLVHVQTLFDDVELDKSSMELFGILYQQLKRPHSECA